MHHHFASKFLIDSLNSHGFCASYTEVKKFEMCARESQGTDIPGITPGHFVQYVADNVDHNVRTLDGYNTFHGMGIIVAVTPATKQQEPVSRRATSSEDLAVKGKIKIHFFRSDSNAMSPLIYDKLDPVDCTDQTHNLDILWKLAWPLRSPRPGWSGMMQAVCKGPHAGQSSIFLFNPEICVCRT